MHVDPKNPPTIYKEHGCAECNNTGYVGRSGIYEWIEITEDLQTLIHRDASESDMVASIGDSYHDMQADGWRRVLEGDTTVTEVLRITSRG